MEAAARDFEALRGQMSGELTLPDGDGWDAVRQAWNLAVDQRPAAVAVPADAADVKAVVDFARETGLRVAPQGTGHGAAAVGDLSSAILLKTHRMQGVEYNAETGRARANAGALSRQVLEAVAPHGRAALVGSSPDVGIVGYALSGGTGFLARKHGLMANQVSAVELVLADGTEVRATRGNEDDLFWALRGGGGSFGAVTAIEFDLIEMTEVYAGSLAWPWQRSEDVLKIWARMTVDAPDEISDSARLLQFPPLPQIPEPVRGKNLVMIDGVWSGDKEDADRWLMPLRDLSPAMDTFAMIPTVALVDVHGDPPEPVPSVGDHQMMSALTPELIEAWIDVAGPGSGSPLLFSEMRHWGGAVAREPEGAGALGSVADPFANLNLAMAMSPEMAAAGQEHATKVCAALKPWSTGRTYLSFADFVVDSATGYDASTYKRLCEIKKRVDPNDMFQSNHPIAGD